jgi:ClpP class serine protease
MKHRRNTHLIEAVYHRPWFITPGGYSAVRQLVERKLNGDGEDYMGEMRKPEPMEIDGNGIAHIEVCGTLCRNVGPLEACCGAYDYEWLEEDLEDAIKAGVRGIMIEMDSPGGSAEGCAEAGDMLADIARVVPVVVYSEGQVASAAYAIACNATALHGSASSTWGSIGCIIPWQDHAEADKMEGLAWNPVVNAGGVLKGTGHGPVLTAAERASLQQLVDDSFDLFRATVLRNRAVPAEAMTGGLYLAPRALGFNLLDSVATEQTAYDDLLARV